MKDTYREAIRRSKAAALRYAKKRAKVLGTTAAAFLAAKKKRRTERRDEWRRAARDRKKRFQRALKAGLVPHVLTGASIAVSAAYRDLPTALRRAWAPSGKRELSDPERGAYDALSIAGARALRARRWGTPDGYELFPEGVTFYFHVTPPVERAFAALRPALKKATPFKKMRARLLTLYKDGANDVTHRWIP